SRFRRQQEARRLDRCRVHEDSRASAAARGQHHGGRAQVLRLPPGELRRAGDARRARLHEQPEREAVAGKPCSAARARGVRRDLPVLRRGPADGNGARTPAATGATEALTKSSTILAAPRATEAQLRAHLVSHHRAHHSQSVYKDSALANIVRLYVTTSKSIGLDPLVAVSQT